jgi:hypothetical protein
MAVTSDRPRDGHNMSSKALFRGDGIRCCEPHRVGQTDEEASAAGQLAPHLAAQVELYKLLLPPWKGLFPPTTDTGELEGAGASIVGKGDWR